MSATQKEIYGKFKTQNVLPNAPEKATFPLVSLASYFKHYCGFKCNQSLVKVTFLRCYF